MSSTVSGNEGGNEPDARLAPSGEDCRTGLALAVAVNLQETRFDGPTKERLSHPEAETFVRDVRLTDPKTGALRPGRRPRG